MELRNTDEFNRYWSSKGFAVPATASALAPLEISRAERSLDFTIGEWDVYLGATLQQHLKIEFSSDGQSIRETGPNHESLYTWVSKEQVWRQTWRSHNGHHDILEGTNRAKGVALIQQHLRDQPGTIGRLTLRPIDADNFATDWQLSTEKGQTWRTSFTQEFRRTVAVPLEPSRAVDASSGKGASALYEFKLGSWDVSCRVVTPQGAVLTGHGTSHCNLAEDGRTILDDIAVVFDNLSGFRGKRVDNSIKNPVSGTALGIRSGERRALFRSCRTRRQAGHWSSSWGKTLAVPTRASCASLRSRKMLFTPVSTMTTAKEVN